ncbi:MAG TPA: exo-alpha-sialidase [Actinomycetota bacterium]|nr:exo-alpha-sialidase [Actinomycetota bacterium]
MHELLIGTKKGLFVLQGEGPGTFRVTTRAFAGQVVEFAVRDPRTGRTFASVTSGFYGPRLMWTDDVTAEEWRTAAGPAFPEGKDEAVERIWIVQPGEADGVLYAGVAPAALFVSTDGGESWSLNDALWAQRIEGDWQPGAGGLALHSICPWPGHPDRLAIGVSAAGVWLTEDGGASWRSGFTGLVPEYMPEDAREGTNQLCVHNMHRAPLRPERLFMQFHGSVYRSDDAGITWNDIAAPLPSGFGFPLAIDPADPDSAFVIPLVGAEDRVTPEGTVRVFGTRDAGASWVAGEGLPAHDAWITILRQAFGTSGSGEDLSLWFGATSGEVFGSTGGPWFTVAPRLAPVTSVRAVSA